MEVCYVSSTGTCLNFTQWPYMINDAQLRDYTWVCETRNGKITGLHKAISEYQIKLAITAGNRQGYVEAVEMLLNVIERDVLQNTPGRLYFGIEYMTGFFYTSSKADWNKGIDFMFNTLTFATDSPFWIREQHFSFEKSPETYATGLFLDYAHDYPYDYAVDGMQKYISNQHYGSCDFEMDIFGPCINPAITIGGHLYEVFATVAEGEYFHIESRKGTVFKISQAGERTNEYNNRNKDSSLFERIPFGENVVTWSGTFGFDITLFIERSEPEWTL